MEVTELTFCWQGDLHVQQQASETEECNAFGMAEDLIIHGEPFTEHKSTFQVGSAWNASQNNPDCLWQGQCDHRCLYT